MGWPYSCKQPKSAIETEALSMRSTLAHTFGLNELLSATQCYLQLLNKLLDENLAKWHGSRQV